MSNHSENNQEQTPEKRHKAQSFFERRKDRVKDRFKGSKAEPKGIRMGRENDGKGQRHG